MANEKPPAKSSLDPDVTPVPSAGDRGSQVPRRVSPPLRQGRDHRPAAPAGLVHRHQIQKLESLGLMAGNIAHDFNNYLMAIMGNADLLGQELTNGEQRRLLEEIQAAASRAADLTGQLLAFSGQGRITAAAVDLSACVREIVGMLKVAIPRRVTLRLDLADGLVPVEGDASQIHQLVMNLVVNAAEAIGSGTGTVTLTTGQGSCPFPEGMRCLIDQGLRKDALSRGPHVFIQVLDDGPGIHPENQDRIFDPFFTTKPHGRGLGLASVLGIVRVHGGQLCVDSAPGKGTCVRVCLPSRKMLRPQTGAVGAGAVVFGSGKTILVVDDERFIRNLTARMLRHLGYEVILASSGSEALEIYRARRDEIDAVVLDLVMPELDGEEVFRRLLDHDAAVRVIMTSGYNEKEIRRRFADRGIAGFIQKPYRVPGLAKVLGEVLNPPDQEGKPVPGS